VPKSTPSGFVFAIFISPDQIKNNGVSDFNVQSNRITSLSFREDLHAAGQASNTKVQWSTPSGCLVFSSSSSLSIKQNVGATTFAQSDRIASQCFDKDLHATKHADATVGVASLDIQSNGFS
jgi:hypothetical protein